ncbi:MAG: succinate dehydrogenase iron-sulfur subunit [Candidatus Omnitrophica bacterium CG11_big_fil_rev_8_21_14_0_20_64_10]|nr:MAG: succinate dehydrogenase iron-sulfur subunit [Candidatus Omnitrophica bacterium CG11_big_fil_rev_8_21_14_0_20_64_10]
MDVRFEILRFDPARDAKPHWEDYTVELEPTDRVLDGLEKIKGERDGSIGYRRSCAHGVCGSDAMKINGRNRLACKVLIRSVRQPIRIEPMMGFTVHKDLLVDMEPFFKKYRSIRPYLIEASERPDAERLQSPENREKFDDTTKCILCGACTTSCPSFWADPNYVGPAAIVQAHRFIFDSRDEGKEERLKILNEREGVWACRTVFNCVDACPRGIQVTRAIGEVKQALTRGKVD